MLWGQVHQSLQRTKLLADCLMLSIRVDREVLAARLRAP
jgi:hypothetical protein